jgi:hypothetical protein
MTIALRRKKLLVPVFRVPLKTSLLPAIGSATPNFTRASTATFNDFEGVIRTAKANEARFPGMRRVQNLVTKSEDFNHASWGPTRVTWSSSTLKLTEAVSTNNYQYINSSSAVSGQTCLFWADVKAAERTWVALQLGASATYFNLANGTIGNTSGGASIVDIGGGYYRCAILGIPPNTNNLIYIASGNGVVQYSGDGTSGIYLRRAQLENVTGQSVQTVGEYQPVGTGGPYFGLNLLSANSNFPANGGLTYSNGVLTGTGAAGTMQLNPTASTLVVGRTYIASARVASISSGSVSLPYDGFGAQLKSATGTYSWVFVAQTASVYLYSPGFVGTVDSLSMQECLFGGAGVDGVGDYSTTLAGAAISQTSAGYLNEPASTNLFLNSATGSTQTITAAAGQLTISLKGTGSVMLAGAAAGTLSGTGANNRVSMTVAATAGAVVATFTGSTTEVQAEAGGLTSYIPTAGSPVTRPADSLSFPVAANANQGALVLTLIPSGGGTSGRYPGVSLSGATANANNSVGVYADPTGTALYLKSASSGVAGSQPQICTLTAGVPVKIAISWSNGTISYCADGGAVSRVTGQTLPLSLAFFKSIYDYDWLGVIKDASVYRTALPDAILRAPPA